jgi:hypothetical protein
MAHTPDREFFENWFGVSIIVAIGDNPDCSFLLFNKR